MTLLLDTGPLVAAIDRSDKHHARCVALLESAEGPLLIPTTVIVEGCWLLEDRPDIEAAFLTSVATGEFQHVTIFEERFVVSRTTTNVPGRASPSSPPSVHGRGVVLLRRRGHFRRRCIFSAGCITRMVPMSRVALSRTTGKPATSPAVATCR